ncbi:HAD family hydrolase [Pseudonocardia acidicola]|uniref:HAD family hydrolase n=1 Tax=Pseudonocardia acidicola TaxID=2724939 RepID=A0ABX1SNJ0_9PSEU|nr:HAD family hydrolase [Pseudonocardia acidicola]NMI01699.1 HAD family hydrolase [Pseudonocardia acidicola]
MADTAVFDVDGTLIDTNYHHALAWYRAFRRHDITLPVWRLHRAIGMGGDHLVAAVAGEDVEARLGDRLRAEWAEEFEPMLGEVQPFADARSLLEEVRRRGFALVLASSGKKHHVDHYLDLIDGKSVAQAWTTADDVDHTKPAPDLLLAAVAKANGTSGVVVGDSVWDFAAADRAGCPGYAVRTGGFSPDELCSAGALAVYESLTELRDDLDDTLLAKPEPTG